MAVLWKAVLSADYVDRRFFRVTLLTDERFADASLVFGGLSRAQMAENRRFLEPLPEGAELLDPPAFVEPPRLRVFAAVATWGGLLLEALIALLCLIPGEGRTQIARHAVLLVFCATTYALAPVAGFGWLIATMGLAQCRPNQRPLRGAYVVVFVLDRGAVGVDRSLTGSHPRLSAGRHPLTAYRQLAREPPGAALENYRFILVSGDLSLGRRRPPGRLFAHRRPRRGLGPS
jgi:hypothetical protein